MLHVFISGPIRPTMNDVLLCLRTLKAQLPPCKIWFSTWETSQSLDILRAEVDVLIVNPEPTFIPGAKLLQQLIGYPTRTSVIAHGIFRMFVGVENIFKVAQCAPDDIVIRFRSDLLAKFSPGCLESLIEGGKLGCYVARMRESSLVWFDDWFGIATYANMRNVWCHGSYQEFEENMNAAVYSAEEMVKRRVKKHGIPILHINEKYIDFTLCRPNNGRSSSGATQLD
jgi:hypothetical protein